MIGLGYIVICSDPTLVGREELYNKIVFFVQSILADRFIHRRELCVLSLESTYILEYGIEKIFSELYSLKGVIEV